MPAARELDRDQWAEYFDALTRELLNSPVSIEITRPPAPSLREVHRLALQTLTYDHRDDVFEIAAARGGPHSPAVLRHFVEHPSRVDVDNYTMLAPVTIRVDGGDGARTVIQIEREPDISSS